MRSLGSLPLLDNILFLGVPVAEAFSLIGALMLAWSWPAPGVAVCSDDLS
jgi:hypothetical protein